MTWAWRILEFFPKFARYKEWPERHPHLGLYIPDCEPRVIPDDAWIHESVLLRMKEIPEYKPVNFPLRYQTVPMPAAPAEQV